MVEVILYHFKFILTIKKILKFKNFLFHIQKIIEV